MCNLWKCMVLCYMTVTIRCEDAGTSLIVKVKPKCRVLFKHFAS
jgi:hypothetical protein